MRNTHRRRPLAFEQMEQRLALSVTPMTQYLSLADFDFSGFHLQSADRAAGGSINVEGVLSWVNRNNNLSIDASFIDYRDGDFIFTGPVFSKPDVDGPLESDDVGSLVTPIPQPQIGEGEIAQGVIAVAEIFRPTKSLPQSSVEQPLVESVAVEAAVTHETDDSWKSVSLSRGRDMYFEVAALSDEPETSDEGNPVDLSSKITPLVYQEALRRRETERASSTTSEERTHSQRQLPALPEVPRHEASPDNSEQSEVPANDASVEKSQRTAQDGELPQVDEFSQVADPHDQAFAAWDEGDELSEEAIALRTESQPGHSATWPVLAALAATGWMTRTRRMAGVLPRHRQPLPRK